MLGYLQVKATDQVLSIIQSCFYYPPRIKLHPDSMIIFHPYHVKGEGTLVALYHGYASGHERVMQYITKKFEYDFMARIAAKLYDNNIPLLDVNEQPINRHTIEFFNYIMTCNIGFSDTAEENRVRHLS